MIYKKGFSIVELLVVIAIIGILSSVQIVRLNQAREKAKIATLQEALSSAISLAILCFDGENDIIDSTGTICNGTTNWEPQSLFCTNDIEEWPKLTNGAVAGVCNSDRLNNQFSFSAEVAGTTVTCSQNGCTKSP
ncbi:MAG: hypothetical protein QG603_134 [Patescibacteria group bacterium]|nr:hypothetical protein [Patescibacteria group bacterium]MDQ5970357.1 hypothetical protein [Patescibacteria group bacterium]